VPNLKALWKIVSKAQNANENINQWANYIKHKGGISIKGVFPESPFKVTVGTTSSNEFEPLQLELDEVINTLKTAHIILYNTLDELIDFIGFEKIHITYDNNNKRIIPQKSTYKKVLIN
jgi:hypothetical protein